MYREDIFRGEYTSSVKLEEEGQIRVLRNAWYQKYLKNDGAAWSRTQLNKTKNKLCFMYLNRAIDKEHNARTHVGGLRLTVVLGRLEALRALRKRAGGDDELRDVISFYRHTARDGSRPLSTHYRWFVTAAKCERRSFSREVTHYHRLGHLETAPPEIPAECLTARVSSIYGDRPQKVREGSLTAYYGFARQNERLLEFWPPGKVPLCVFGSFETSAPLLGDFLEKSPGCGTYGDLDPAIHFAGGSLGLAPVGAPTRRAFFSTGCNPRSSPGGYFSKIGKSKGRVHDIAAVMSEEAYWRLQSEQLLDFSPWTCGGREKRQWRDVDDQLKSRLIQMPEASTSNFSLAYAAPLIEIFREVERSDVKIGLSFSNGKYKKFVEYYDLDHCKAFDWASFDARVGEELLVTAFGILRSCYPKSVHTDRAFIFIMSNFVKNTLITPSGHVVRVERGIPSGHPFTSLIGSVVNWLIHRSVIYRLCGASVTHHARVAVCGDDTLVSFRIGDGPIPETEDYLEAAKGMWGAIGKLDPANEGFLTCFDAEKCLPFLSYRFPGGLPGKGIADTLILELGGRGTPMNVLDGYLEGWCLSSEPPFNFELLRLDIEMVRYYRRELARVDRFWDVNLSPVEVLTEAIRGEAIRHFAADGGAVGAWGATWGDNRRPPSSFPPGHQIFEPARTMGEAEDKMRRRGKSEVFEMLRSSFLVRAGAKVPRAYPVPGIRPRPPPKPPPDKEGVLGICASMLLLLVSYVLEALEWVE